MSEALFVAFPGITLLPLCVYVHFLPDAPPRRVRGARLGSVHNSGDTDGDGARPLGGQLRP